MPEARVACRCSPMCASLAQSLVTPTLAKDEVVTATVDEARNNTRNSIIVQYITPISATVLSNNAERYLSMEGLWGNTPPTTVLSKAAAGVAMPAEMAKYVPARLAVQPGPGNARRESECGSRVAMWAQCPFPRRPHPRPAPAQSAQAQVLLVLVLPLREIWSGCGPV